MLRGLDERGIGYTGHVVDDGTDLILLPIF